MASTAACRACSGVGKSGWPRPRLMASSPAASNTSRMPEIDTCSIRDEKPVIPYSPERPLLNLSSALPLQQRHDRTAAADAHPDDPVGRILALHRVDQRR